MSNAKHTPGWCWMAHPSRNEGRPIPVLLATYEGADWYIPLDPMDATDFLWDERDSEWEMIRDPLAEAKAAAINEDLLEALRVAEAALTRSVLALAHVIESRPVHAYQSDYENADQALRAVRAAITKATGSALHNATHGAEGEKK